ncbi:MAG: TerC family protein [Deltaproteobacteria bacterium]|nr:TerC family protein [Deltaproteobacteria bacterium]
MTTIGSPALWLGFLAFVLAMLALDLGVFHRKAHAVGLKEAAAWSGVWISLALVFNLGLWHFFGAERAGEFFAGYLIEKSLSVDNIFVFVLVFTAFAVPATVQHRVLFWGVLGALVLRALLVFAGAALVAQFHGALYLFGAFLVFTAVKMLRDVNKPPRNLKEGWFFRAFTRLVPTTDRYDGAHFLARVDGRRLATPLLVVLVLIELTDLVFAVDSIPAIFAVTTDPFIVFTSNIFAILGLRSLYFLLAGVVERFHELKLALAGILFFVGGKLLLAGVVKVPIAVSLGVIGGLLALAILASLVRERRARAPGGAQRATVRSWSTRAAGAPSSGTP